MALRYSLAVFGLLALAAVAPAQEWRLEKIDSVGIKFEVCGRLERIPMKLGPGNRYHRARLRPKERMDYINGEYLWYCDVYEFPKKDPEEPAQEGDAEGKEKEKEKEKEKGEGGDEGDPGKEARKQLEKELAKILGTVSKSHDSFSSWLGDQEEIRILTKDKDVRGSGSRLPYKHWEWLRDGSYGRTGKQYAAAAVYEFEDREVALVIEMPVLKRGAKRPHGKWWRYLRRMIQSGRLLKEDSGRGVSGKEAAKDKYADTDYKKRALAKAKKNIKSLRGWDYFTTPHYIVLYAWDFEKRGEHSGAYRAAKFYSSRLEKMRELYVQHYPLDETGSKAIMPDPATIPNPQPTTGPITPRPDNKDKTGDEKGKGEDETDEGKWAKKMEEALAKARKKQMEEATDAPGPNEAPYPVFRLCATYDQFRKYGQSPPGVVGWFSPVSKELVVFLGGDKMMGDGATETVTYHEGWHQFADLYFPGGDFLSEKLHRWFDEGHGDFFGSFRWTHNKWRYVGSQMRHRSVEQMVRKGDYVPFKDIVRWSRQRFYSGKAAYYYAQAYSMIDYFRRGEKLKKYWDPRYGEVLDMYRKVILFHGDSKRAVDTAFRGFEDKDWKQLEEAWQAWVKSSYFKDGE